jgi:type II secretory pathway pseudopilin PulG
MRKLLMSENRRSGVTLVEMVVSILILGTTLGAMLGVFLISKVSVINAKYYTAVMNLARARMEDMKDQLSQDYNNTALRGVSTVTPSYPYQISNTQVTIDGGRDLDGDGDFSDSDGDELTGSRITQVEPIGSPEQYLEVTVTITWSGYKWGGGTWQGSDSLVTYIGE